MSDRRLNASRHMHRLRLLLALTVNWLSRAECQPLGYRFQFVVRASNCRSRWVSCRAQRWAESVLLWRDPLSL
jgi:hypothetical protein